MHEAESNVDFIGIYIVGQCSSTHEEAMEQWYVLMISIQIISNVSAERRFQFPNLLDETC
jgi:hypothetical protein